MAPTLPVLESIRLDAAGPNWRSMTGLGLSLRAVGERENIRMEIGDDYVLGVWSGEQGVEYVRMYGLEK